jgi:hypothetical protein
MNFFFENPFWLFVIVFIGYSLLRMFHYGGLRGSMFGAPVEKTLGEVSGSKSNIMSIALKVYSLNGSSTNKDVGLEIVAKSFASYQMTPISLSVNEAKKLITLLESATKNK